MRSANEDDRPNRILSILSMNLASPLSCRSVLCLTRTRYPPDIDFEYERQEMNDTHLTTEN